MNSAAAAAAAASVCANLISVGFQWNANIRPDAKKFHHTRVKVTELTGTRQEQSAHSARRGANFLALIALVSRELCGHN